MEEQRAGLMKAGGSGRSAKRMAVNVTPPPVFSTAPHLMNGGDMIPGLHRPNQRGMEGWSDDTMEVLLKMQWLVVGYDTEIDTNTGKVRVIHSVIHSCLRCVVKLFLLNQFLSM